MRNDQETGLGSEKLRGLSIFRVVLFAALSTTGYVICFSDRGSGFDSRQGYRRVSEIKNKIYGDGLEKTKSWYIVKGASALTKTTRR